MIPRGALGRLGKPTDLVRDAHAAGLKVHPWTCLLYTSRCV
ncbi:hypothetical protein [Sphingopyxis bauzanensis]|nr:hypothetical protein [Sphingopyxis bauzanensis]